MLYTEITLVEDFFNNVSGRCENLSFYAKEALFEYWRKKAESEDIKVSEALTYGVLESDSAMKALADHNQHDKLAELEESLADEWMDEDEAEEEAFKHLQTACGFALCVRLSNSAVLTLPY